MELPLTLWYILKGNIKSGQTFLDIGSPKLLSLYFSVIYPGITIISSDISNYFVSDFQAFNELLGLDNMQIKLVDGRAMDFENDSIDQVFSISVIEHIPGDGDSRCMAEIGRVLKPGGQVTITLPYAERYCEEWLAGIKTYWSDHSIRNNEKVFFQRRYLWEDVIQRIIKPSGLKINSFVLTAEKPIRSTKKYYYNGKIEENCNYIEKSKRVNRLKHLMSKIGLSHQWLHSYYSRRYLYFTHDKNDRKALNIALQLEK